MRARTILILSLLATASPLALAAQTTTELDEIRVGGTGAGEGVPAGSGPATTVEAEEILRTQAGSISDVLRAAPSVNVGQRGSPLMAMPNIRGFGGGPHMANDPASQVAVDGVTTEASRVYQNASGMPLDPALLKSVTVRTGPLASLEYGSGIAGGTVVAETIDGADLTGDQVGVRFRQLLGAHSNGNGWATSSTLAWQPGKNVDFLFNFSRRAQEEQKDGNGALTGVKGYNVPNALVKARFRINDSNAILLSWNRSASAERNVPLGQASGAAAFGPANRDREGTIASAAWTFNPAGNDLVDMELKFSRSNQIIDIEALPDPTWTDPATGISPAIRPAARGFAGRFELDTDRLTLKNTARFVTGSVSHELRAGIEWSKVDKTVLNVPVQNTSPGGTMRRLGVFAIDNMDFGNELKASVGVRIERQSISGANRTTVFPEMKTTARTAGLGVEKGFGNGFAAFGQASYGETLANLDVFHQTSPARGGSFYGQGVQKSVNLEAGLKFRGQDVFQSGDRLSASVSAYRTAVRNAMYGPTTGGTGEIPNYLMRGVELQARYDTALGIYAQAALNVTNSRERSFSATADYWGDYRYNPGKQASLTLGKKWDSGFELAWTLHATAAQTVVHNPGAGTQTSYAGWGVNDLVFSYTPQSGVLAGASLNLAVENVFDKAYRNAPLSSLAEPGRNVKLTIAKTF